MSFPARLCLPVLMAVVAQAQAPVISFNKTHHDFGKVDADRKVSYRFKVTNTGKAPLQIHRTDPSCGCTSTVVGKWYLTPGESTDVEVVFDAKSFRGLVRKSLQVVSNDPVNPSAALTFEAEVVSEITPSTTALFFQDLSRQALRKSTVRLVSGNGKPVQIKETKIPGAPYLSTSVHAEGNDAVVEVQMDGRKIPAGQTSGLDIITLRTTSSRVPQIPLDIQWEVKPAVTASPDRLAWVESAGKPLSAKLVVVSADGKPFRVMGAKPSRGEIQVMGLQAQAAPRQELTVHFQVTRSGMYQETLVLQLDHPEQPELRVRVSAVLR